MWALIARAAAAALATLGLAGGCAQTPQRGPGAAGGATAAATAATVPTRAPAAAMRPETAAVKVHDGRGTLAPADEARALARVKAEGRASLVEHHLRVLAATGEVDLYRDNRTKLLVDGPATLAAMKAAIARARTRVLLESYIIDDGAVADEMARLLAAKAREGVQVAVLYDAVGSVTTDGKFFDNLAAAGVAVCKFNPINPLERPGYWGINHRNHRKVLVVDNELAFTGGINIARAYSSGSSGGSSGSSGPSGSSGVGGSSKNADDKAKDEGWRDTHIELAGPVVEAIARGFTRVWGSQGCGAAIREAPAPARAAPGERIVKVIESDPRESDNRIYDALLAAVSAARRSIHLSMAYFAPGQEMVQALADAARRGVEVGLLLPGRSDFALVLHAGRSYYEQLLAAGVRIHEMPDAVMHAKTAVIDGVFSTVGSSNMDWRSLVANNEINVIVLGDDFGAELERLFERDVKRSEVITLGAWRERGWWQRVKEAVGRAAERWL